MLTAPFCTKLTLDNLNSPCLEHDPNNRLAPYQIISYQELNVVAPISSLAMHKILFFLLTVDYNFQIYSQSRLSTQNRKSGIFLYI